MCDQVFFLLFQVSFGEMIGCDNEEVCYNFLCMSLYLLPSYPLFIAFLFLISLAFFYLCTI